MAQPAAAVAAPAPVPAPNVIASYRAMISAWLESHKRYPEIARQRGEEGSAALRFRIDRSGRVLDYNYSSTGYADLDAGLDGARRAAAAFSARYDRVPHRGLADDAVQPYPVSHVKGPPTALSAGKNGESENR